MAPVIMVPRAIIITDRLTLMHSIIVTGELKDMSIGSLDGQYLIIACNYMGLASGEIYAREPLMMFNKQECCSCGHPGKN